MNCTCCRSPLSSSEGDLRRALVWCTLSTPLTIRDSQCDTTYNYQSAYILSLEPALPVTQPVALDALPTALSGPIICDFGQLFQLDTVLAAQAYSFFVLLRILLGGGLDDLYTRHRLHEHHRGVQYVYTLSHRQLAFHPHPSQTLFFYFFLDNDLH